MSTNHFSVTVIHSHRLIDDINVFGSRDDVNFGCPECTYGRLVCFHTHNYYSSDDDPTDDLIGCDKCDGSAEIMFHCARCEANDDDSNGFDYCLRCGIRELNILNLLELHLDRDNTNDLSDHKQDNNSVTKKLENVAAPAVPAHERFKLLGDWIRNHIQFTKENGNTDFDHNKADLDHYQKNNNMKNNSINNIKDYYFSQSKSENEEKIKLIKQVVSINITSERKNSNDEDTQNGDSKEWDNAFDELIACIKKEQFKKKQLVEAVWLYNNKNGLIKNGNDLKTAIQSVKNSNNYNDSNGNNINLTLISNVFYLSESQTSKMLKLKDLGYKNEQLNLFKLAISNWDIEQVIKYYKKDKYCISYFLDVTQTFYCQSCPLHFCAHNEGDHSGCNGEHSSNINIGQMIMWSDSQERYFGYHFCKYLLYLRKHGMLNYSHIDLKNTYDNAVIADPGNKQKRPPFDIMKPLFDDGSDALLYTCCALFSTDCDLYRSQIDLILADRYYKQALQLSNSKKVRDHYNGNSWIHYWYAEYLYRRNKLNARNKNNSNINNTHTGSNIDYFDECIKQYKTAIEIDNKISDYHHTLGERYYEHKDYNEAIKCMKNVLEITPDDRGCLYWMGLAYFMGLGDFKHAFESFGKMLQGVTDWDDIERLESNDWVRLCQYEFESAIMMYQFCWVNQFAPAKCISLNNNSNINININSNRNNSDNKEQHNEDNSNNSTFKIVQHGSSMVLKSTDVYRKDSYSTVYIFEKLEKLVCGYLRRISGMMNININMNDFSLIIQAMINDDDKRIHLFHTRYNITSNILKCIQFNQLYFIMFETPNTSLCKSSKIQAIKIPQEYDTSAAKFLKSRREYVRVKMLASRSPSPSPQSINNNNKNKNDDKSAHVIINNSNKFEFGIIGVAKHNVNYVKYHVNNYSYKYGISELIDHICVDNNDVDAHDDDSHGYGIHGYYIHIDENNPNLNYFRHCKPNGINSKSKDDKNINRFKTISNGKTIGLKNIDCQNDTYHVCIEYKSENKNDNSSSDDSSDSDDDTRPNEYNHFYYLSMMKNSIMINDIGRIELDNERFEYYFVFGCVPTSSWFTIVPE